MTHNSRAWSIAAIVAGCLVLIMWACTPDVRRDIMPRDLTTSPEPTNTLTATATITPTATTTATPSPTMQPYNSGVHVYANAEWIALEANCDALLAAGATETWTWYADVYNTIGVTEALHVCNVNATAVTCELTSDWYVWGYSAAHQGIDGCYPQYSYCGVPSNFREVFGNTSTQPCTIGGYPTGSLYQGTHAHTVSVFPWASPNENRMEIRLSGGSIPFGACTGAGSYTEMSVNCGADAPTATSLPTWTPRPTRTPSPTPSPTVTRTPVATRPTATATVSPTAWTGIMCPTAVVTVDANRADWTAIPATPMPLSATDAAYIWPAATPSVADLSGIFWCAHSADTLFLSGVITDSVLYQDSAPVDDDAAQIAIDGWGDGFLRYRADDHELTVTQDGRLRDLATLPITATVATTLTVAGWQFEIGIPKSVIELPTLTQRLIGLVFGVIDDDDGGQLDQQIIAPTRTVLLQ